MAKHPSKKKILLEKRANDKCVAQYKYNIINEQFKQETNSKKRIKIMDEMQSLKKKIY